MTISIEVPNDLYEQAEKIARTESMSVSEVLTAACTEHLKDWERIQARAKRGSREKFLAVLAKVPHGDPGDHDRI